ncbi:MAG: peptide chain release factor N(5)-glutamine methyltransferase [Clostridia bacterium]|nr:peptide chain release factor N(5)-glutamine methyltransferase [Clostridia bacterium]
MNSKETYASALKTATDRLAENLIDDARFDARCLLAKACGKSFNDLMFCLSDSIEDNVKELFDSFIQRRVNREPLQYILGEWDFFGLTFSVGEGVLIPRPETEFLAETAIRETPLNGVVFDVCSGSGCIGITVAKERRDVSVYLFEKYDSPFVYSAKNISRHGLTNVTLVRCDMTKGVPVGVKKPDVILSNPPYIESSVVPTLQAEVQREPVEALDGGDDGYIFYRHLSKDWFSRLKDGGIISMECGENMPKTVAEFFKTKGAAADIHTDMYGVERFVTVKK